MKQKGLAKMFMMISNWKNFHGLYKNILALYELKNVLLKQIHPAAMRHNHKWGEIALGPT